MKPFLKWAGGKRWLVDKVKSYYSESDTGNYIEPFLGGGAVYLGIEPDKAILSDANEELINTYIAIRDFPNKTLASLKEHSKQHCDEYYYKVRSQKFRTIHTKAARFIYLNRTCFNGLYRVNLNGEFNVPRGSKNTVVSPDDNFESLSKLLHKAQILHSDFEDSIAKAKKGDFVYIDPPYTVNHNLNGFLKYNEKIFSWADQVRLEKSAMQAVKRGAKVVVSNAYHDSIKELYSSPNWTIDEVFRKSVIASKSKFRNLTSEAFVVGKL